MAVRLRQASQYRFPRRPEGLLIAVVCFIVTSLAVRSGHGAEPFEVLSLPTPLNLHGSAVVGDFLHIISGDRPMPEGFTPVVLSARINDDLSLSPWIRNRPLPINLIYITNNVLVVGDMIYIVGGQEARDIPGAANPGSDYERQPNNTAIYARVAPNGIIGEWQRSGRYPGQGGRGAAAATDGRFLYVMGGMREPQDSMTPEVFFAPLGPDGSVGDWRATAGLPTPLSNHSAYFHNGNIYIFGGRKVDATITNEVLVARVRDDGQLDPWVFSPARLAVPVEVASSCAADDYLFLFCGQTTGGALHNAIQYSMLTSDGITAWASTDTSMSARIYASAALDRQRRAIYISGGRFTTRYTDLNDKVFCFPLRQRTTEPGHVAPPASSVATMVGGMTASSIGSAPATGFLAHTDAMRLAAESNRHCFLVIYSSNIGFTRSEVIALENSPAFRQATQGVVIGKIDIVEHPDLARQLGLIRVPAYFLLDPSGNVMRRETGRRPEAELISWMRP